jgi:hypothetical protein
MYCRYILEICWEVALEMYVRTITSEGGIYSMKKRVEEAKKPRLKQTPHHQHPNLGKLL